MANLKKTEQVESLISLLRSKSHFALLSFEGTKHKALEQLRKDLRSSNAQVNVTKNTLFEKAILKLASEKKELAELSKKLFPLKKNSALLMLDTDYAAGLSTFFKFAKKDKTIGFKFGLLDSTIYLAPELEKIAQLPGKDQLIAKVIGGMKSPSFKLVYSMKFNISKLTLVLKERAKQTN